MSQAMSGNIHKGQTLVMQKGPSGPFFFALMQLRYS